MPAFKHDSAQKLKPSSAGAALSVEVGAKCPSAPSTHSLELDVEDDVVLSVAVDVDVDVVVLSTLMSVRVTGRIKSSVDPETTRRVRLYVSPNISSALIGTLKVAKFRPGSKVADVDPMVAPFEDRRDSSTDPSLLSLSRTWTPKATLVA